MANNPKRPGTNAGNTFTKAEIDGIVQLFEVLHRGADPRVLLRQEPIRSTYQKFQRMKAKLDKFALQRTLGGNDG